MTDDRRLPASDRDHFTELVKRIPAYISLSRRILLDPDVPAVSRAILAASGAYAVSPIDLVPGIIPVAGQLDDAWVLLIGLRQALRSMPSDVAEGHLAQAGITWQHIDSDIALVVRLAKRIGRAVITTGVQLGRAGTATVRIAGERIRRFARKTIASTQQAASE